MSYRTRKKIGITGLKSMAEMIRTDKKNNQRRIELKKEIKRERMITKAADYNISHCVGQETEGGISNLRPKNNNKKQQN